MKYLSWFTSGAVLAVAVGAFVLAFFNVEGLAIANGVPAGRAWLVPVIVEGAMIALALTRLEAEINRQDTRLLTWLVGAAVVLSIALNWAHSNMELWGVVIAVIQPISLLVAFESFMYQLRHRIARKQQGFASIWQARAITLLAIAKHWRQCAREWQIKAGNLQGDYDALLSRADNLQGQASELKSVKAENVRLQGENGRLQGELSAMQGVYEAWQHINEPHQAAARYNAGEFDNLEDAASIAGVSPSTISRIAKSMNGAAK